MNRPLFAFVYLLALAFTARADAERQVPTYPFRVERAAAIGQTIAGAKGDVIYWERSLGREAAFLAAPMPARRWPIQVAVDEPLFPIMFAAKGPALLFYCSNRFKVVHEGPRETVCFRDGDKDGRFDQVAIGERDSGFVFEITGRWIETTSEDIEGSRVRRIGPARTIEPARYAITQVRPSPDDAVLIEVRYAGLRRGKPVVDVSFRTARSGKALYTKQITAGSARAALPHPLVAYRISRTSPRRIGLTGEPFPIAPNPVPAGALKATQMIIDITKADATHMSGTIRRGYPGWSIYKQDCEEDAAQIVHVEEGHLPVLIRHGDVGLCEKVTWVQDGKWWIVNPEYASSGPLQK